MKLIRYLKNPYPPVRNKWRVILSVACFVFLFLLIFQPFGLQLVKTAHKFLLLSGYGVVTFVVLYLNLILVEGIFSGFFAEKNRTILKHIGWQLWILFSIGLANYLYSTLFINGINPTVRNVVYFQFFTLAVGIFPVILITSITHNYLLKKNMRSASFLKEIVRFPSDLPDRGTGFLELVAESGRESVTIPAGQLIFIESVGNYATVCWSEKEKPMKKMLRTSLKQLVKQVAEHSSIVQCHRAFLVNLEKISDLRGNAQGYQLILQGTERMVPVSRSFIPSFSQSFIQLRS